jgi:CheY-like chemotaxis protein
MGALAKMLTRRGYEIYSANSANEALSAVDIRHFDLVISDIGMPGKDGWALLVELRKLRPELRAIALTGFGQQADIQRSKAAGFDLHLVKPATADQINAAIRTLFPFQTNDEPRVEGPRAIKPSGT